MKFGECLENVHSKMPLIHNITNYVTVNDVANVLLACGGSPIMNWDIRYYWIRWEQEQAVFAPIRQNNC